MDLHELCVASLGGDGATMAPAMALALEAGFGSVERWRDEFVAMADAPEGRSGWRVLALRPLEGRLVNRCCAGRAQDLVGDVPLLALALAMDGNAGRAEPGAVAKTANVDAFLGNVAWAGVYARYRAAVDAATESLGASPGELEGALLVDVRRAGVFAQASAMLADAHWRDPAHVARWAGALPADREIVVYCVYGHEVGRATALRLRAAGLRARYLRGGIDGWQAEGRAVVAKPRGGVP